MAFNIKSAGLVTTGTTGNDLFAVQSGAVKASTILGLAGNDNIQVVDGAKTASSFFVNAEGGKDVLTLSGGSYDAATVAMGAGGDIFSGTVTTFNNSTIKAGDGNDTINLVSGTFTTANLTLGGGADSLTISGGSIGSTFIGAGAGKDTVAINASGAMASAQILGGGSDDLITVSGIVSGKGLLINGDSSANGGGADTITFVNALTASTIKGKGGKDVITVSGGIAGTGAQVLGNAGADNISVTDDFAGTANLIGAGAGNDTITLSADVFADGNSIIGGGGNDSISLLGNTIASGVVYGGDGADSITISAGGAISGAGLAFAKLTESTLSKMDVVDGPNAGASALAFSVSAVTTKALFTGVAGGEDFADATKLYSDGVLASADFKTAAGLTARATTLDASGGGLGATFVFTSDDTEYLFIQGGASGTADDLVVNLGKNAGNVVSGFTVASGKVTLG